MVGKIVALRHAGSVLRCGACREPRGAVFLFGKFSGVDVISTKSAHRGLPTPPLEELIAVSQSAVIPHGA